MNARRKSDKVFKLGVMTLLSAILGYSVYDHRAMSKAIENSARSRAELYQRLDADSLTHSAMEQRLKVLTEEILLVESQQKLNLQKQAWLEAMANLGNDRARAK